MTTTIRDCERFCPKCKRWKHYNRFRKNTADGHRAMSTPTFKKLCKACEQIERNEAKNKDRPYAIIHRRATTRARELGVPVQFLWVNMNWRSLVPIYRALLTPEALCQVCGHPYLNERDITIEHHEPSHSRPAGSWAREHARNLGFACSSCNTGKGKTPFVTWLDEQEDARLANETHRENNEPGATVPVQLEFEL